MPLESDSLYRARQYWDSEADAFDKEPDHGLSDPVVYDAWQELLAELLPAASASILDVGCGTGSLSLVMAVLGHDVTGIDLSPAMIARAKRKAETAGYPISFGIMDASSPDLAQRRFAAVLCRHLLWSFADPALVLGRWSNLLLPGGRLILIEGHWHTGGGLRARQTVAALPPSFTNIGIRGLSEHVNLWGREVTDERYVVVADLPVVSG